MKTNILFVFTLIIFTLFFSCDKLWPPEKPTVTTTDDVLNFQMIISDSGSIIFKNSDDLLLNTKDVEEIVLIDKDGEIFEDLKIIEPNYTKVGNKYRLEFEITTLVEPKAYIKHYALKFNMVDDSYIEIDKTANLYKYPYGNAELFMRSEEVELLGGWGYIQDFDIVDNYLYYHPYASFGLFRYNLLTRSLSDTLRSYWAGDHIAVAEKYIFIDYAHSKIERYNTNLDSIDLVFDLSHIYWADCDIHCSNLSIYGMSAHNNIVYVLMKNTDIDKISVVQFNYEGNFLNETPFPVSYGHNLEYYDGVLYTYNYNWENPSWSLNRFDLASNSLLESKLSPTPSPDGISIVNGRFYYADYNRKIICSIPITDLMD